MRAAAIVLAIAGCSYQPAGTASDSPTADALEPDGFAGSIDVAHLGAAEEIELTSTTDWTVDNTTTINTTLGAITPGPPAGVVIIASAVQQNGGPAVMVIQASVISIEKDIRVDGDKPLIFVATTRFSMIDATIDASALDGRPGGGGFTAGLGPGAGGKGTRVGNTADSGGGGASYGDVFTGSAGGDSQNATALGGLAGPVYGGANLLQGGSGGGSSEVGACVAVGGPGGGAIQISAPAIELLNDGGGAVINVGGGGGDGGPECTNDGPGGAGGGSGGMIFLDAPMLLGDGRLLGLGAGGGEGASADGSTAGADGADAGVNAGGGGDSDSGGGNGGRGGSTAKAGAGQPPTEGVTNGNGGGGGGGIGRIYFRGSPPTFPFESKPPAVAD